MRVPLEEVRHLASNSRDLNAYMDTLFEKCSFDDPPYMSDLIVGFNEGGIFVMEALEAKYKEDQAIDRPMSQRYRWRLQVLKDEWGQPVKPGDVVEHIIHRSPEHGPGKPFTAGEVSTLKLNGLYEKNWVTKIPYVVDEKGCINCGFVATSYFLQKYGIHGKSGAIISHHRVATSADPQAAPTEGFKHVHYWRFKEVDRDDYEKLAVIADRKHSTQGDSKSSGNSDRKRVIS